MRSLASALLDEPDRVLEVREARDDDMSFVLDSALKSYANSPFATSRGSRYYEEEERVLRWCIVRGQLLIACDEGEPDVILGWACGRREPAVIDYLYTKSKARRLGVASMLVKALLGDDWRKCKPRITHRPQAHMRRLIEPLGWVRCPVTAEEMDVGGMAHGIGLRDRNIDKPDGLLPGTAVNWHPFGDALDKRR